MEVATRVPLQLWEALLSALLARSDQPTCPCQALCHLPRQAGTVSWGAELPPGPGEAVGWVHGVGAGALPPLEVPLLKRCPRLPCSSAFTGTRPRGAVTLLRANCWGGRLAPFAELCKPPCCPAPLRSPCPAPLWAGPARAADPSLPWFPSPCARAPPPCPFLPRLSWALSLWRGSSFQGQRLWPCPPPPRLRELLPFLSGWEESSAPATESCAGGKSDPAGPGTSELEDIETCSQLVRLAEA